MYPIDQWFAQGRFLGIAWDLDGLPIPLCNLAIDVHAEDGRIVGLDLRDRSSAMRFGSLMAPRNMVTSWPMRRPHGSGPTLEPYFDSREITPTISPFLPTLGAALSSGQTGSLEKVANLTSSKTLKIPGL